MARFYSPEWVDAFNQAVSGPAPGVEGADASAGRFKVGYQVVGGPDGDLAVALVADGGQLSMEIQGPPDDGEGLAGPPQVIVSLSYEDAAAMSRGELEPAGALAQGRVRVRGDLAVLVASQALLAAAAGRLAGLRATTTY